MTEFSFLHTAYFADAYPEEWAAVRELFPSHRRGAELQALEPGTVVIPRYRATPFGVDLEREVVERGSRLINSFAQHLAIDDIFAWAALLGDLTAPTYRIEDMARVPDGRFFVKAQVSSLKNLGPQAVFADTKAEAVAMATELENHWLLGGQVPVIRPVQDYLRLGISEQGMPAFHEQRVFTYLGKVLGSGFYWSGHRGVGQPPTLENAFWTAVDVALERLNGIADFLVLDMAQYVDGRWGVVELNDACHAGFPPAVSPSEVFRNLLAYQPS
ncbi:ATP-grasp domain-containing protein [Mycobacteroides abscessus]|uniref:ATP-grasp domain-containing protein n=1 Tax=Mycobacteroides abscessus TaxID=36809 RepID=UPI0013000F4F|nr:ATP-grasp domain-containing protein [Mycobacteroides abscessus]